MTPAQDLEILSRWRLQTRNKIESSNIEESVVKCVEVEDDRVKALASEILASWGELKLGYRIPKAVRPLLFLSPFFFLTHASPLQELKDEDGERKRPADFSLEQIQKRARLDDSRASSTEDSSRPVFVRPTANRIESGPPRIRKLPDGWEVRYNVLENRDYYVNLRTGQQQWDVPRSDAKAVDTPPPSRVQQPLFSATELIAQAEAIEKEKRDAEERKKAEEKAERERERAERHKARKDEKEEKERKGKEKRVMGLFSNVVVQTMSKYKSQFEGDAFKKRAKEVRSSSLSHTSLPPTFFHHRTDKPLPSPFPPSRNRSAKSSSTRSKNVPPTRPTPTTPSPPTKKPKSRRSSRTGSRSSSSGRSTALRPRLVRQGLDRARRRLRGREGGSNRRRLRRLRWTSTRGRLMGMAAGTATGMGSGTGCTSPSRPGRRRSRSSREWRVAGRGRSA